MKKNYINVLAGTVGAVMMMTSVPVVYAESSAPVQEGIPSLQDVFREYFKIGKYPPLTRNNPEYY